MSTSATNLVAHPAAHQAPVLLPPDLKPPAELRPSPGRLLAHRREALGLRPAEIAAELHLTESWIQALERDDFSQLPGDTFVRGYLKGYARVVATDPAPILAAYAGVLQAAKSRSEQSPQVSAPASAKIGRMWLIRVVLAVTVAFGLAAILLFWPQP